MQHTDHQIEKHRDWSPATPEVRRDLSIIVKTANDLYGPRSHWVEEREVRRPDADPRLRFDPRVLQDDAAAGPYAQQLTEGCSRLRFTPELEREYVDHVRSVQRRPATLCVAVALFGWVAFGPAGLLMLAAGAATRDLYLWAVQGAMVAALCAGLVLLRAPRAKVRTDRITAGLLGATALALGLLAARSGADALPGITLAALGAVVACFFPLGLVFRRSVVLALAMAVGGTVLTLLLLRSGPSAGGYMALAGLWGATGLAALSAYLGERLYREQFLLHGLLSRQAFVDPLTGLYTRRGTHRLTQTARLQAIRDSVSLSFVLMDVDHFRAYNRRHGREAGDRTLCEITKIVGSFARRPLDVASREGGKRFGLLLYDCNLEQARLHAEQLRERLRDVGHEPLTVSIGAVQVLPDETADEFMQRVERLLQRSKDAGRDRVTIL
ncbi:MAG: GGDEF domain-containing protein [Variovorax sp.]|nr:MAG: GGDEF domain-containing protein [Variovorax sp.]